MNFIFQTVGETFLVIKKKISILLVSIVISSGLTGLISHNIFTSLLPYLFRTGSHRI